MEVDLEPITRIVWWNKELKELWVPRLRKVSELYNNTEIATAIAGMRDVYVYHVASTYFQNSYKFLRDNDFIFYPTNVSGLYQGFSHKHTTVQPDKPYMVYGACVKRGNEEKGEKFIEYTNKGDHAGIGRLLGYPECCIEFFERVWNKESIDPMFEAATWTDGAEIKGDTVTVSCHPYCNQMLRYFGARITPHLSHSMDCKDTIKWGEEWFEIMQELDPESSSWLLELLSVPTTWDCYKGIAIIDTPMFRALTNSDGTLKHKKVVNRGWTLTTSS